MTVLARGRRKWMRFSALCAILFSLMPLPAQNSAPNASSQLPGWMHSSRIRALINKLGSDNPALTEEQIRITAVPAPPFQETARGAYMARLLTEAGLSVKTDDVGNVIARRPGRLADSYVLVAAHLDTVFPAGTDLHARREGPRVYAPGISDNGTGLVTLLALARALRDANIQTEQTILFVADVGEEGEGNLRGMRKL